MTPENQQKIPANSEKATTPDLTPILEQSQKLLDQYMENYEKITEPFKGTAESAVDAFTKMLSSFMSHPENLWQAQYELYQNTMRLWANTMARFMGEPVGPAFNTQHKDRRFAQEEWKENLVFDYIRQSYLMISEWFMHTVESTQDVDPKTMQRLRFYTKQFVDAISPSNFLLTNPEVLKETIATQGQNLVRGLENLLKDMQEGKGHFDISMTDDTAFKVGKNIASTPGKIVFQNDLMQLIQYSPSTKQVFKTPLLIIAPWINKYYILDLQPQNSFIKWLVDQGHTVFVTSWVNPGPELAHKRFEDYMQEGILDALDAIEKATGEKSVNAIGYCIGGTLLSITLSYLKAKKQASRILSSTFLTTLTDFSQPGELGVFIDDMQMDALEEQAEKKGVYDGRNMAFIFRTLRANDLIWSFVVNNYLLGKDPLPFDLLYWNEDATSLPADMHLFYLRNMYRDNLLVKPGGMTFLGVPIELGQIDTPSYFLSTKEDHIAPWDSTYAATKLFSGPLRFVLSASGHVAGIVNPPSRKKYGFWVNDACEKPGDYPKNPQAWLTQTQEYAQSWWEDWQQWITSHGYSGKKVPARKPGSGALKAIEDAPGSYVMKRLD